MDITITPLDPADPTTVDQAYGIKAASVHVPDMPPSPRQWFEATIGFQRKDERIDHALAYLDGVPVGLIKIEYPLLDNLDNAGLDIQVLPEYRRRGVGRALYAYGVAQVRAAGRTRIMGHSPDTMPGGVVRDPAPTAFAQSLGAKSALVDVRRRLDIDTVDAAALDALLADSLPRAAGYELLTWAGEVPDAHLDDIAYLDGRLVTDAPMGDLQWEAEQVDAARIREFEAFRRAQGVRGYHVVARHVDSGRIVAWTHITCPATPDWHAIQQITIVDPDHRGHRLGLIVKIENLRLVTRHEPALRVIDTWNADSNRHMIAINEAIGYRAVDIWQNWQQTI
ncbi:GNAT family N-acetyltransferase [Solwaraspora sp. WMMA2056]|uniref:GNAT family N-acetyltransferase n=1 Tax=Solwaraspora sp. WMMA2056 TaxID=3015161 RepID=UPI00259BAE3C|nr:GNAT family N-acetyltransferase [Solwaraspora sp. WMMA2056]WJK41013.1 GNAT family N-acetyltransferase [Solwaraspora sp. WMMA2056]